VIPSLHWDIRSPDFWPQQPISQSVMLVLSQVSAMTRVISKSALHEKSLMTVLAHNYSVPWLTLAVVLVINANMCSAIILSPSVVV